MIYIATRIINYFIMKDLALSINDFLKNNSVSELRNLDVNKFLMEALVKVKLNTHNAKLENYPNYGTRLNVLFCIFTVSYYQTLLSNGISPRLSKDIMIDGGWKLYKRMLSTPKLIATILFLKKQKKMNFVISSFVIFPFTPSEGGYEAKIWNSEKGKHTHWTKCPPCNYVKSFNDKDLLEMFKETWCYFDFPAAEYIVKGGKFEREHCLSYGDDVCDMLWTCSK